MDIDPGPAGSRVLGGEERMETRSETCGLETEDSDPGLGEI